MADDFQVKQSSSSSGAYGLGGAAIGGLGAGYAAHHFTKPKYGSYDDIIKEAKDSTDFSSKIEKAEGDEKKFLEEAKKIAGKRTEAEADFDKQFSAWKEKNPNTEKIETEDYKKLVQAEKDAQTAVDKKKNELVEAKIKDIKANGNVEKITIDEALNKKAKQIAELTKYYETQKAKGADADKLNKISERVKTAQKEADELATKLADKLNYGKLTGEALDNKKKEVADAYKLGIQDRVTQKLKRFDAPLLSEDAKLLKDYNSNKKIMSDLKVSYEKELKEFGKIIGKDLSVNYEDAHSLELMNNKAVALRNKQQTYVDTLTKLQDAYKKVSEGHTSSDFSWRTFFENLKKLGTGEAIDPSVKDIKAQLEKYLKDNKILDENDKKAVKRLINGEINEANIKQALDGAKNKVDSIDKQIDKINDIVKKGKDGVKETNRIKAAMQKRGVYVKDGELIDKKTGNKVKPTPNPAEKPAQVKLPKGVDVPKDVKVDYTSKVAKNMTEEEIKKQAEASIKESQYQAEADVLKNAKNAREEAYKGLKDGEKLSDNALVEKFCKDKGYESKTKFADKAVEDAQNKFKNEFKQWFERRHGFAEGASWKIAGVAAAGALVLGGLASLMAPKDNA